MPEPLLRVVQASEPDAVRLAMHRMSKEMREILMGVTSQLNIPDGDAFWVILAAMAEMVGAMVLARSVDDPELAQEILDAAIADLTATAA